jgi:purine-binding chemotaxis protein CheW
MSIQKDQSLLVFNDDAEREDTLEFVTLNLADQLLGIPVLAVHDVLRSQNITQIPKADKSIAGVLNLRGRIVTAIDLRTHLGFPEREEDDYMCVVIEHNGDPYSFLIDTVGEVLSLAASDFEKNPVTLDERLREVSKGIFSLEKQLLIILDVDRLLSFKQENAA